MATSWVQCSRDFYAGRVSRTHIYTHIHTYICALTRKGHAHTTREKRKPTHVRMLCPTRRIVPLYLLGALCSACTPYSAVTAVVGEEAGDGNLQDSRDLTHSSRESLCVYVCMCACIILDLMQPALPTLITVSFSSRLPSSFSSSLMYPIFFFFFFVHLLLEREVEKALFSSLSIPTLDQMPANGASRCPWRRAGPRVG